MDSLTESLLWCVAQVTLVGLLAWLLCAAISRWTGPGVAIVPATALAAVVVLTACAFLPWPPWWRYGPRWQAEVVGATTNVVTGDAMPHPDHVQEIPSAAQADTPFDLAMDAPPRPDTTSIIPTDASPVVAAEPDWTTLLGVWLPRLLLAGLGCGVMLGLLQLAGGLFSVAPIGVRASR